MTRYRVGTTLTDALRGKPYIETDSIDKARKIAIETTRKKVGYYGTTITNADTGRVVGEVVRPYYGDTEFIWKTTIKRKEAIYNLYPNGKLGEKWGKRPGY